MVSVFLLLLDTMIVFESGEEILVSKRLKPLEIGFGEYLQGEKEWEGEVRNRKSGDYTESGGQERKNYNVLGTKGK